MRLTGKDYPTLLCVCVPYTNAYAYKSMGALQHGEVNLQRLKMSPLQHLKKWPVVKNNNEGRPYYVAEFKISGL